MQLSFLLSMWMVSHSSEAKGKLQLNREGDKNDQCDGTPPL